MKRSLTPRSLALLATSVALSFAAALPPANAQYFNNVPYALSTSLLYPLGRVFLGGGTSIYNITNPYYLTNRFVNGGINSSGFFRAPGYGPMPMGVSGYTDEEPLNAPRQRNRPFRYGQWGVDQTAYAGGGYIQPNPNAVVPQAVGQPGAPGMPAIIPPQQANQMPPTAPQRGKHNHNKHSKNQQFAQYAPPAVPGNIPGQAPAASPAPLAQGFVTMVNTKFDGDISKALFSAEGRSWAHTVGLVDNSDIFSADLSQERVNVIGKIFKDPGLDPVSKLDAVKILLRTSPAATAAAGASN